MIATLALAGLTVVLPQQAEARGVGLTLGEIARLETSADGDELEAARAQVAALDLGNAPCPGFARIIAAERVAGELARLHPTLAIEVRGGPCRVTVGEHAVGAAELRAAAEARLRERALGESAEFELVDGGGDVVVPAPEIGVELVARPIEGELVSGLLTVPVQILVDGVPWRTVWTSWRLTVWRELPVLARAVRRGEELAPGALELRRVKVDFATTSPILSEASVTGAVATRDLAPGALVTALDVHRPVVVVAGSTVAVEVRKGRISARATGTALDSGAIGSRVRIELDGGREISARVVGRESVVVDLGATES